MTIGLFIWEWVLKRPGRLLALTVLAGCQFYQQKDPGFYHNPISTFAYDLSQPINKYYLGYELEEVSGLSWYRPGRLACVQDEEGKLYIYDLTTQEVTQRIKFAGPGDFEGVEIIDYQAYAVNSSGDIFTFNIGTQITVESQIIKTPLNLTNNVEGLGFDTEHNRLILACKGSGDVDQNTIKGKAVYGYRMDSLEFDDQPIISVTKKQLQSLLAESGQSAESVDFGPSGIAFHPLEKRYYLVSFVGHLLVIIDSQMHLQDVIRLDPRVFRQPEGICFSPDGAMYISSEGNGGNGYILEFAYQL